MSDSTQRLNSLYAARLRNLNDVLLITGQDYSSTLLDAAAEIERLRGRIEMHQERIVDQEAELDGKDKEIERLREQLQTAADNAISQGARMQAEIERLREQVADQQKDIVCDEQRVADLMEDVQRLDAEIERLESQRLDDVVRVEELDNEIERLRREEAHTRVLLQGEKAQAKADKAELRAEIERLQTERDRYKPLVQRWKGMAKDCRAEVERLREQLQRATSLPTASEAARNVALEAEVERLQSVLEVNAGWMKQARFEIEVISTENKQRGAEIERLRGELDIASLEVTRLEKLIEKLS